MDPWDDPPLTVAQLVDALSKFPRDAPVTIEGCDCSGQAHRVTIDESGSAWIRRARGEDYLPDGPETWPPERRLALDEDDE